MYDFMDQSTRLMRRAAEIGGIDTDAVELLSAPAGRQRLACSLDLMGDGPFHARLTELAG